MEIKGNFADDKEKEIVTQQLLELRTELTYNQKLMYYPELRRILILSGQFLNSQDLSE